MKDLRLNAEGNLKFCNGRTFRLFELFTNGIKTVLRFKTNRLTESRCRSPRRKNSKKKEFTGGYVYSVESVVATSRSLMLGGFVSFHESKEERKGRPFSLRPSRSRALVLHLSLSLYRPFCWEPIFCFFLSFDCVKAREIMLPRDASERTRPPLTSFCLSKMSST